MNKLLNVTLAIAGLVIISACGSDPKAEKINKVVDLGMKYAAKHVGNKAKLDANKATVENALRASLTPCNDADLAILSNYFKEEASGPAWDDGLSSECRKGHDGLRETIKKLGL